SQPRSREAFPPCFVAVCGWVVCAKNWQLLPETTARMPMGTEIAEPHPASIGTGGMRAEVPRGVHVARPSPRGDHAGWRGAGSLRARHDALRTSLAVGRVGE